jgi:glycosyltransferase involved in cell wall biosynthesis
MRRSAARAALGAADVFIAGSNAIRADYAAAVPRATPFHVIPYGIALAAPAEPRQPARRPLRFGYVGSIAPHKGVHVAVDAMRAIDPAAAVLHLWGDAEAFPEYVRAMSAGPSVVFEGRFREEEKPRVYAAMDVLLVPSIGLESFGLAAREAMACGVPVVASAGGALSEMFEPGVCGDFFPPGDAVALRGILQRLIDDPALVDRWSARLPQPKRDDVHAEEIERVYRSLLAARAR